MNVERKERSFWKRTILILWILFFALGATWAMKEYFPRTLKASPKPLPTTEPSATLSRRAPDGIWVNEKEARPFLTGVLVENMANAQPISGVDKAALVIEAPVEGGITRLLTVYPVGKEEITQNTTIGPVRSVRPYFLDWADELGVLLAHVGGSPAAIDRIRDKRTLTLDQWYKSDFFQKDSSRAAPHDTYIDLSHLQKAGATLIPGTDIEKRSNTLPSWSFKEDAPPAERGAVNQIVIPYPESYAVTWRYNSTTNIYTRFQWGGVHTTSEGIPISTKNIVILFQKMEVLDTVGRLQISTIGAGDMLAFFDGNVVKGTWEKADNQSRTRLLDASGRELTLNAGPAWITIVAPAFAVTYSQ